MNDPLNDTCTVHVSELRRLLIDLKDIKSSTSIRFRLLGEPWGPNYLTIAGITEKGAIFVDKGGSTFLIENLDNVMQFEIDGCFNPYQSNHHYRVSQAHMYLHSIYLNSNKVDWQESESKFKKEGETASS